MKALVIGVGGLGAPASLVLAKSGVELTLIDDDVVDESNLHRQILFGESDIGLKKIERAAAVLTKHTRVRAIEGRFVPDAAIDLVRGHDVVIEGADNFATKFLALDACMIARVPLVQAGAVRWSGWAFATVPGSSACMRCVFEDIPGDRVETCAEAGVVGPLVGALGAIQASLALRILLGDGSAAGELWSYRALESSLRATRVRPRRDCPACAGEIRELNADRYDPPHCST